MNPDINKFQVPNTGLPSTNTQAAGPGVTSQLPNQLPQMGDVGGTGVVQPTSPAAQAMPVNPLGMPASPSPALGHNPLPSVGEGDEDFEKKWVAIAKTIVERTKNDPYLQSQELSKAGREFRAQVNRGAGQNEE